MNPQNYNPSYTWNGTPRHISTPQIFAAVIRDVTGICTGEDDPFYPVHYDFGETILTGFRIMSQWCESEDAYGYWWEVVFDGVTHVEMSNISDIWTAKINLCLYLGCTEQEINDIFWNGKTRDNIGCVECPCNKVEGRAK